MITAKKNTSELLEFRSKSYRNYLFLDSEIDEIVRVDKSPIPSIPRIHRKNFEPLWLTESIPVIDYEENNNSVLEDIFDQLNAIKDLKENWDEEGAIPVSIENINTAKKFLQNYYSYIQKRSDKTLPSPNIDAVPNASIDIVWINEDSRMLININEDTAKYYGDLYQNKNSIKGQVETDSIQDFLASWMINYIAY